MKCHKDVCRFSSLLITVAVLLALCVPGLTGRASGDWVFYNYESETPYQVTWKTYGATSRAGTAHIGFAAADAMARATVNYTSTDDPVSVSYSDAGSACSEAGWTWEGPGYGTGIMGFYYMCQGGHMISVEMTSWAGSDWASGSVTASGATYIGNSRDGDVFADDFYGTSSLGISMTSVSWDTSIPNPVTDITPDPYQNPYAESFTYTVEWYVSADGSFDLGEGVYWMGGIADATTSAQCDLNADTDDVGQQTLSVDASGWLAIDFGCPRIE